MKRIYWILGIILILLIGTGFLIYSILYTSDAGQECSSSNECEGECIAELSIEEWERMDGGEIIYTTGKCSARKRLLGCYSIVENGAVAGDLCFD